MRDQRAESTARVLQKCRLSISHRYRSNLNGLKSAAWEKSDGEVPIGDKPCKTAHQGDYIAASTAECIVSSVKWHA